MRRVPPLNHLRSFEAAARHLSFTAAATELACTQAAVSLHVRSLEDFIGRPLFRRYARSLALTSLGEAYLPTVHHALAQVEAATEAIMSPRHDARVVVSCPISLATNWLPARLAAFRARHPGIDVTVEGRIWRDEGPEVADIRIEAMRREEAPKTATVLWADRLAVLAPPGPSLTEPAQMEGMALIHNAGRPDYWPAVARHFALDGLRLTGGTRANGLNLAMEMAVEGLGLAVIPREVAARYVERGLLTAPFGTDIDSGWVNTLSDESLLTSRAARLLHGFLARAAG